MLMKSSRPARSALALSFSTLLTMVCVACATPHQDSESIDRATPMLPTTPSAGMAADVQSDSISPPATVPDALHARLAVAEKRVSQFFATPFPKPYAITVFSHRSEFDAFAGQAWGMPKTECWMVAAGVSDRFVVLDPAVWASEACEHDAGNAAHVDGILTHELVHVLHGQLNPTGDFTGMDPLGWFVEGLAVYASGQIDAEHSGKDREAIAANAVPKDLQSFWSGEFRYGISGSLVRYIDLAYGRATLLRLLPVETNAQALEILNITEPALIAEWRGYVTSTTS